MNVKYAYSRLLLPFDNSNFLIFDEEAWFSLLSQGNEEIEQKIWDNGYSLLKPCLKKGNTEELFSPLYLLIEIDEDFVIKNIDKYSQWLNKSVFQLKINNKEEYLYDFYNKEQENIFYKLIDLGLKKETYNWIKLSNFYPKPHIKLEEIDIRRIIFNNYSIVGLNTFYEDWGKDIWTKKWNFKKNNINFIEEDYLFNPNSFWPIECGFLYIEWLKNLLEKKTSTDILLDGIYNKKDIETITLRVLKISLMILSNDLSIEEEKTPSLSSLWIRREQHPLKSLEILLSYNSPIEGSWNGNPWWDYWLLKRKDNLNNWESWDVEILLRVDSLAEKKKFSVLNSQNNRNKKRI